MLTALLIFTTVHLWAAQPDTGHISQMGVYHGDEWKAPPGDDWLALIASETGFTLIETTVHADKAIDAIVDENGQMTGKRVTTTSAIRPIFLFQGLSTLKPGPISTLYNGFHPLAPDESLLLTLPYPESAAYRFHASGTLEDISTFNDYVLHLDFRQNGQAPVSQALVQHDRLDEEAYPGLLWVGDLDRDGKLDLIADITYHYNVQHLVLYLSSYAKQGQLVGLAAELKTSGC